MIDNVFFAGSMLNRARPVMAAGAVLLCMGLVGCGKPSAVNIELRKENQDLRTRVETLERAHAAHLQDSAARDQERTVTTLPADRLDRLTTTHGIRIGRLTKPADFDLATEGNDGIKLYFVPVDAQGDSLKSTGQVTVELFDLAAEQPRLEQWTLSTEELRPHWRSGAMLYTYVVDLPWQQAPAGNRELTLKVTFTDELTGRVFTAERKL